MTPEALLDESFALVAKLGVPLAVAAWLTVFGGAIALGLILRRVDTRGVWPAALGVGGLGLTAHLLDYFVTLKITPDLSMEANPIWRVVIDNFGLWVARVYGLSGKLLLSVVSTQLFAWHLAHRASLFPTKETKTFSEFVRQLGQGAPGLGNIRSFPSSGRGAAGRLASFFAFAFALFGPYFFYITFMNVTGAAESELYERLPSPPVAILVYFAGVIAAYFGSMWRAFRSSKSG
jgi:hypothetical protein